MPIKTSSGKWKWGNIERSSKKELVQTVYGIWKKNGSKGSFSDFLKGTHESVEPKDKFFKVKKNGKEIGKYGLSFYDDIKAVGIGDLEVYPEFRNKGYGTKIIKDIVDRYKNDYDKIYCFVDKDNKDAIRLYKRLGKVSDEVTYSQKIGDYEYKNKNGQHYVEFYNKLKESIVTEKWSKNGRYLYCDDCDRNLSKAPDDQYIMIDDDLWEYVCKHGGKKLELEDVLCRDCIEKRLGRRLTLKDLGDKINLPVNDEIKKMLKKRKVKESIVLEGKSYNVVKINSGKELYKKYGGDKTGYNGKSEWFPRLSSTYKLRPINDKYCLFVLEKKDWDKIEPPNPNTTNAYDDYGTSLIVIVVEVATGKLLKATLRWNRVIDPSKTVKGTSVDKAFLGWNDLTKITGKDIETEINGNLKDKIDAIKKDSEDADNQINEYLKDNASSIKELDPNSNFKIIKKFSDKVTKIEIPNGITKIGDLAFNGCSNLASISIPDTVTSIGDGAFERCTSLASISIPDSVTSIGEYAFSYCSNLTSIKIPDGVTSIKSAAFYDCSNLTSISIPDSVTNIGDYIFFDCSKLNEIYCSEKIWNRIKDEIPEDVERKDPTEMKKESIGEATTIHSYPEKLQPIIDRIVKGNEDYELDHAYFNKEGKFIWMRNSKGYFHIFKPVKLKNVKWKPFALKDMILQDDGMMKPIDIIQFENGQEGLRYLQNKYSFEVKTMSL